MDQHSDWLDTWCRESRAAFDANHRIKSFGAFLEDLRAEPYRLSRNASQYLLDMIEHFGARPVEVMGRELPRFKVFDAPFDGHSDPPLSGQEEAVLEIHSALRNLVSEGRADRILHLHGPNGSAKSLIVELLMKGCEAYSATPEGARYTFAWVFPSGEDDRKMGFGGGGEKPPADEAGGTSFAHLPADHLEARIPCDAADSPLLLIPRERRLAFIKDLLEGAREEDRKRFVPTRYVDDGDLCPRCRMICDALIEEYRGDMTSVLRHVQVRRTFISRRYRRGAVVISPQDTPDATSRQITLDASLSSLPRALQHLNLVQLEGDLIDANNGLVEFSAFLTRAPEMNKYLLAATERGELTLPNSNVYLDTVLFATSNERHLEAFKQSPDFSSFKGRSFLIPVPYLLERRKESELYGPMLGRIGRIKHVGPHIGALAALWAVLTRLHRPDPARYPEPLAALVARLTPEDKCRLYDGGLPPAGERFSAKDLPDLRSLLPFLREEYRGTPIYEGRFGASPREMREVLYGAAFEHSGPCLGPGALFAALESLLKDRSLYLFLQIKPDEAYHDVDAALRTVRREHRRLVAEEIASALGLIPGGGAALFANYLAGLGARGSSAEALQRLTDLHGSAAPLAGQPMAFLHESGIEPAALAAESLERLAIWAEAFPGRPADIRTLFADRLDALVEGAIVASGGRFDGVREAMADAGTEAFEKHPEDHRAAARGAVDFMISRHGYCETCAAQAAFLLGEADAGNPEAAAPGGDDSEEPGPEPPASE